jgi:hypothetical protein
MKEDTNCINILLEKYLSFGFMKEIDIYLIILFQSNKAYIRLRHDMCTFLIKHSKIFIKFKAFPFHIFRLLVWLYAP